MGMFLLVSYTNMVKMLFYMLDHANKAEKTNKKNRATKSFTHYSYYTSVTQEKPFIMH